VLSSFDVVSGVSSWRVALIWSIMQHMTTSTDDVPAAVNANEAARLLSVHPETLRRWVREGLIPAAMVGHRLRIARAVIDDVLTNGTQPAGAGDETRTAP
jgi:excisionase family DNA binding protein